MQSLSMSLLMSAEINKYSLSVIAIQRHERKHTQWPTCQEKNGKKNLKTNILTPGTWHLPMKEWK